MRSILTLTLITAALMGCGSKDQTAGSGDVSHVHFITFGPGTYGLVKKVKQPTISACTSGISTAEQAAWNDKIKSTVLKWVQGQRAFTGEALTQQVEIRPDSQGCDLDVQVTPGTWSNTSIGSHPVIRMDNQGYFASYNVLLHEMGHAFALSDTYQGASGDCKPGQPQSVMCNTSFDDLQADDIAGLKEIYQDAFPGDQPGTGGGTQPPVNPPVNPPVLPYKLFAALGAQVGAADGYQIHASLTQAPTGQDTGTMAFCNGAAATCSSPTARWIDMTRGVAQPGVALWSLNSGTVLAEGLTLTLRYTNPQGVVTQGITFKRR